MKAFVLISDGKIKVYAYEKLKEKNEFKIDTAHSFDMLDESNGTADLLKNSPILAMYFFNYE